MPDASRANYFPQMLQRSTGTPAHVLMQPFTPVFKGYEQPSTPNPSGAQAVVENANAKETFAGEACDPFAVISSDSGSDSSESGTCA